MKIQGIEIKRQVIVPNLQNTEIMVIEWLAHVQDPTLFDVHFGEVAHKKIEIDVVTVLLNKRGRIQNWGRSINQQGTPVAFAGGDIVYFNMPQHASGAITLSSGKDSAGLEQRRLEFRSHLLPQYVDRISVIATIHKGHSRGQHFGQLAEFNLHYRPAQDLQDCKFCFQTGSALQGCCTSVLLDIRKMDNNWVWYVCDQFLATDNFVDLLKNYA